MPEDYAKRTPHPIVEKLEATRGNDDVVEIEGYLGSSGAESTRVYFKLNLRNYLEVPNADILHVTEPVAERDGRVKLYVKGSAQVRVISVKAESIQIRQLTPMLDGGLRGRASRHGTARPRDLAEQQECMMSAFLDYQQCTRKCLKEYPGEGPEDYILRSLCLNTCEEEYKAEIDRCNYSIPSSLK